MGTVASIELPEQPADVHAGLVADLEAIFRGTDERFSLYRPGSEISRIADRTLNLMDASGALRASYARSLEWGSKTFGLFTPHRPDGALDLNGIVKAEAIESAGLLLDRAGCELWSINVGGDILVRAAEEEWLTGIADPDGNGQLLATIALGGQRRALATSGSAHRGDHIWRGSEYLPAHYLQVSVVAHDIVTADVLATAIVAGGPALRDEITDRWPVDVLLVDREHRLEATPGFRAALVNSGE